MKTWIDRLEEGLISLLLLAMTGITFSQVIARYVFNSGAVWALELTVYLFAWLVLIGASQLVKTNAHLGIAFVVLLAPRRVRPLFGFVALGACLLYVCLMLWGSASYVLRLYEIGIAAHDLAVPKWIPLLALPTGLALLLLRFVQAGIRLVRGEALGMIDGLDDAPPRHGAPPSTGAR